MVHSICDRYPKFGAAAPRQTGVITRRKKWGRLTPPPSKCRVKELSGGVVMLLKGMFSAGQLITGRVKKISRTTDSGQKITRTTDNVG